MSTRMRLAAGVCALSVALLSAGPGGPVATAETDADGSISNTNDPQSPSQDGETHDGGETQEAPGGLTGPMALGSSTGDQPGATAMTADNTGSGSSPAAASQESSQPETVVSHTLESSSDSQTSNVEAASLTNAEVNSLTSGVVNSSTDDQVNPPAGNTPAAEPAVVQPAANAIESVESPASSAPPPPPAAPPVVGVAAANDLIKVLASVLIAVTPEGVPYIKIPNSLLSLLGIPSMAEAATGSLTARGIGGSLLAGGLYTAARIQPASSLSVPTGWPGMLIAPDDSAALASARAAAHPTPGGVGASGAVEQRPVGIKAVLAGGFLPERLRSVLQHTVDAVLAPLSMLALAVMASPGVAGLLLLSAAGMFVGYRQAKAASMLRAVGMAQFVKAGPLGVVRSGGLVALHTRPSTAARPASRRPRAVLETVA
jgi:hypothetical protein